jgi:hypothetical protein
MRRTLLVLALLLGGCVNLLAQREAFLQQFVGKPDSVLVQQLGVPTRSYETGGVKYLAYTESRVDLVPSTPALGFGPPFWGWYGGGFPPQVVNLVCETTFAVTDGTVRSFTLRGNACG